LYTYQVLLYHAWIPVAMTFKSHLGSDGIFLSLPILVVYTPPLFAPYPSPKRGTVLPQSHIAYTLATVDALKESYPAFNDVDHRLLALAAMGPDLIDKPFAAAYFYRKHGSAVLFAHTLLVHLGLLLYIIWKKPNWWPYAIAFVGHALLDRLWFFENTWYWPFKGWRFHVWRKAGSEQSDIKLAYWYAFTRRPELWRWELGGLIAGLWFIWRNKLFQAHRLKHLLLTGQLLD